MSSTADYLRGILATAPSSTRELHASHINPTYVEALALLGYGRSFVRAEGASLWDETGREYVDFVSSYGTLLLGHNHPEVREALETVLEARVPNFLQVAPHALAGALAQRLAKIAPGGLEIAYFMSSGSEAVDGALKLARAVTHRSRFVSAERGFHGITFGALSVTGGAKHRAPFGPLLPGCERVPWGDAFAIERELRRRDVAAVILEPIQGEGGMRLPPPGYLAEVARLCKRYGTLFILDEIQTGLGRTGRMFACEAEGASPDILLLAKGLSGGLVPISAYLTRKELWAKAYGTLTRYDVHSATFTGGPLACAAALATLEIIERDGLPARAAQIGSYLGERLSAVASHHPLIREIRGRGLLWGIELRTPGKGMTAELVGQWIAVGMMERGVVTQVGTQAPNVIRAEPPLIVEKKAVDRFVGALEATLAEHATGLLKSVAGAAKRIVSGRVSAARGASA